MQALGAFGKIRPNQKVWVRLFPSAPWQCFCVVHRASLLVFCVFFLLSKTLIEFFIPHYTLGFVTLVAIDRLVDMLDMEVMMTTRQGCDQSYCASWRKGSDCRRHGAESIEISAQK